VFAIPVPKDFGTKRLTWTLTANGPLPQCRSGQPPWIDFFKNTANGNEPPRIKFAEAGPNTPARRAAPVQTLWARSASR
jgi:hypothetical protein